MMWPGAAVEAFLVRLGIEPDAFFGLMLPALRLIGLGDRPLRDMEACAVSVLAAVLLCRRGVACAFSFRSSSFVLR